MIKYMMNRETIINSISIVIKTKSKMGFVHVYSLFCPTRQPNLSVNRISILIWFSQVFSKILILKRLNTITFYIELY